MYRFRTGSGERIAPWQDAGEEQALSDPEASSPGDKDRGKLEHAMGCDEAPELQAHAGEVAGDANHSNKQAVERHHVNCAQAGGNAECEGGETDAHVVGHDGARGHRLDADYRMGPHLVPINGFDHLRTEDFYLEVGILIGEGSSNQPCNGEDQGRHDDMGQVSAERCRVGLCEKRNCRHGARPMAGIDGIVGAHQQLVDVARVVHRSPVFPDGCQVSGSLTIEQAEILQVGARQRLQATGGALIQECFELRPVRFALLEPAGGNHGRFV